MQWGEFQTYDGGFTLVELLVVIVVVGVFSAIAILGFSGINTSSSNARVTQP
jgi:prepilin-type N-terminal cleavage/methylation domain-containing protein